MGHDHHFLSRLDRVALPHAERALALYRDHVLVRDILQCSSAPDDAERIAISLGDPVIGPFVIVARSGHFITCLGDGMRTELHVVPRAELDRITEHVNARRVASAHVEEHRDVIRKVFDHGEALVREDLAELRAVQPILEHDAITAFVELGATLVELVPKVRRVLTIKSRAYQRPLQSFYRGCWIYRNLMIVLGIGSPRLPLYLEAKCGGQSLTEIAVGLDSSSVGWTAAWLIANLGPETLEGYWRRLRGSDFLLAMDSIFAQLAIVSRHPACHAEVTASLELAAETHPDRAVASAAEFGAALLQDGMVDEYAPQIVEQLREQVFRQVRRVWTHLEEPSELSLDFVYPLIFERSFGMLGSGTAVVDTLAMIPIIAKLEAEQLCLPQAFAAQTKVRERPKTALAALRATYRSHLPGPVTHTVTPERNAPCPCGSGAKYKRCCGLRPKAD